jgi:hypothetical protein
VGSVLCIRDREIEVDGSTTIINPIRDKRFFRERCPQKIVLETGFERVIGESLNDSLILKTKDNPVKQGQNEGEETLGVNSARSGKQNGAFFELDRFLKSVLKKYIFQAESRWVHSSQIMTMARVSSSQ